MVNLNNQVIRQLTKVKRIITELAEQNPKISERLDTLLYAVIKVEKMVKKMEDKEEEMVMNFDEIEHTDIREDGDQVFKEANQMVEKFKRTTYKFEKKMNLYLNETYFKNKGHNKQEMKRSANRKEKKSHWPDIEEEDQSFKQLNDEIAELVEQLIWQNQEKREHDEHE